MWFMFVFPFIIFFVVFLGIITTFFKTHKQVGDIKSKVSQTISAFPETYEPIEIFVPVTPKEPKIEYVVCEYCGSKVKSSELKCNACGAKIKAKK